MPDTLSRDGYTRDPQFSARDAEVLRFLGEEDLLGFTFEGLRRRLGTHSETLSRILHRLEDQMILEKMPDRSHKAQASHRSLGHGSRTGEGLRGQPQGDDDVPSDDE